MLEFNVAGEAAHRDGILGFAHGGLKREELHEPLEREAERVKYMPMALSFFTDALKTASAAMNAVSVPGLQLVQTA